MTDVLLLRKAAAPKTRVTMTMVLEATKKGGAEEEGVEVVLDSKVTKVMDSPDGGHRTSPHAGQPQNVFRPPPSGLAVRPRATRPPSGSGSFPAPPQNEYQHPHHPMTVPYNPSGSFEEGAYYQQQQQHHSPHVHYPQAGGRYPVDDVNVISPSHGKGDSPERSRPPRSTQSRGHRSARLLSVSSDVSCQSPWRRDKAPWSSP